MKDPITEVVAERGRRMQVDLVSQEETKLVLQTEEGEARNMARFEFHDTVVARAVEQHLQAMTSACKECTRRDTNGRPT